MVARLDAATDFVILSRDTVVGPENEDSVSYPEEFLHTLQPNGVPPHALHLRRGVVVIVLRNLDKERGICNGVRCVVLSTSARMLDVRVISGPAHGQRLFLPRIPFRSSPGELPFVLRRRQFPVKVACAISIHKAQGQSLKHCGVYLEQPVFTHGQLYVSASRATSASGLRFCLGSAAGHGYREDDGPAYGVPHTHNIVYAAVLGMAAATGGASHSATALQLPRNHPQQTVLLLLTILPRPPRPSQLRPQRQQWGRAQVPPTTLTSRPKRRRCCMNGCYTALMNRKSSLQLTRCKALTRMPWAALVSTI